MPSSYSLGKHFESFIEMQLASGRYNDAARWLRDARRLMEERERRGVALDAAIERGLTDVREGHTVAAEDAFDALGGGIPAWPKATVSREGCPF